MADERHLADLLRHSGWVHRTARALLADSDDADDVTQVTAVAAWKTRPTRDRDLRPWLGKVLRNAARDLFRRAGRRRDRERVAELTTEGAAPRADELIAQADLHRIVAEALAALDEPFRQTVLLRFFEALSSAEIARRLGVPAGTVRWRLKEGLARMRAALDERFDGDRSSWRRALVPLLPVPSVPPSPRAAGPRSPPPSAVRRVALLAAASAATVLVLGDYASRIASERPVDGPGMPVHEITGARSIAGPPADPDPEPGASTNPAAGALACQERVRRLHEELVQTEADLFTWDHDFAFSLGGPNPAAERELGPIVERTIARQQREVLGHELVCRTWMCQLAVRKRQPGSYGATDLGGGELRSRVRSTWVQRGRTAPCRSKRGRSSRSSTWRSKCRPVLPPRSRQRPHPAPSTPAS